MAENGIIDNDAAQSHLDNLKAMMAAKTARPVSAPATTFVPPSEPAPVDIKAAAKAAGETAPRRKRVSKPPAVVAEEQDIKLDSKQKFAKGNKANPWGRSGKTGNKGFSFKTGFNAFFARLTEEEQTMMWQALAQKAASGDVAAMKLLLTYNKELDQPKLEVEADTGVRITLTMPPMEA